MGRKRRYQCFCVRLCFVYWTIGFIFTGDIFGAKTICENRCLLWFILRDNITELWVCADEGCSFSLEDTCATQNDDRFCTDR